MLDQMRKRIAASPSPVVLPGDFADLGDARQVRRALGRLMGEQILARISRGVFARLRPSSLFPGRMILDGDFGSVAREALTRLGIPWRETRTVQDYNAGRTTQVQMNCVLAVARPVRRCIEWRGMRAQFVMEE